MDGFPTVVIDDRGDYVGTAGTEIGAKNFVHAHNACEKGDHDRTSEVSNKAGRKSPKRKQST